MIFQFTLDFNFIKYKLRSHIQVVLHYRNNLRIYVPPGSHVQTLSEELPNNPIYELHCALARIGQREYLCHGIQGDHTYIRLSDFQVSHPGMFHHFCSFKKNDYKSNLPSNSIVVS
jgi:hypothetical protein